MQRNDTHKDDDRQRNSTKKERNFINIRGCVTFKYVFGLFYVGREGCKSIIYYNYYNNNQCWTDLNDDYVIIISSYMFELRECLNWSSVVWDNSLLDSKKVVNFTHEPGKL